MEEDEVQVFFDNEKYEQAVELKERLSDGKSVEKVSTQLTGNEYGIEPRVVLMAGWLKRLDEFKDLKDLFSKYNEIKRRFYPNIIMYLHSYYEKMYRGW